MDTSFSELRRKHVNLISESRSAIPKAVIVDKAQSLIQEIRETGHTVRDLSRLQKVLSQTRITKPRFLGHF